MVLATRFLPDPGRTTQLPGLLLLASLLLAALLPARLALAEGATPATPAPAPRPEASIAFADHGGVWNWEADGNRGIWVQSSQRSWYYGAFTGPCFGLQFHEAIKFRFSPSGSLDRYSQVQTRDSSGSCWFKSFTASDGPPKKVKSEPGAGDRPAAKAD